MSSNGFDDIGTILKNAIAFRRSSFEASLTFEDPIAAGEQVAAHTMFTNTGGRWFLRYESLPGIVAMKAIGVDVDGLYLETSPIPKDDLTAIIREHRLPLRISPDGGQITTSSARQLVVRIERLTTEIDKGLSEARELWTIPLSGLQDVHVEHVVRLADLVYTKNSYETSEPDEAVGEVGEHPTMRMQLGFQQQLQLSQRPLLAQRQEQEQKLEQKQELRREQTQEMQLGQRLEIQQILSLQYQILRMSEEELLAFAMKDPTPAGQKRTLNVLIFVLAGRVKNLKPSLPWKEARRIARKSVYG